MDVIKWLGIPEGLRNSAMLSLTHSSMRVMDNDVDGERLKRYYDTGKNVYEALLVRFISKNFSLGINGIIDGMEASKSYNLMYNRLRLNELSVVAKGVDVENIIPDLVYQFFGFLYEETDFLFTYGIFTKAFKKEDVSFIPNYIALIHTITGGKGYQFIEIESGGLAHNPYFLYKLSMNGKEAFASGSSKKMAKKLCAQKYCEENFTQKDIFRILGYEKPVYQKRKKYISSEKDKAAIAQISSKWGFSENDIYNALVNKYLYNEYEFDDRSSAITIGGVYERMLIRKIVHRKFQNYSHAIQMDIVREFENNDELFRRILKELEMSGLFAMYGKLKLRVPIEAINKDAVRQLIYVATENNNKRFLKLLERVVVDISRKMNPYLLDPAAKINTMYGQMKETEPNVIFTQSNTKTDYQKDCVVHYAKILVKFGETTVTYAGKGSDKQNAKKDAYSKFWKYLYNSMNGVFKIKNPDEYTWFFTIMSNHIDWLGSYLKWNNHFVYDSYKQNDFNKVFQYFHIFHYNVKRFEDGKLITKITEYWEDKVTSIRIDQNNVLLSAIWEYNVSRNTETFTIILENVEDIVSLSNEHWKRLLRKNGKLIRYIDSSDEEMQLIAVQQFPQAINYITNPFNSVINYVHLNSPEQEIELRTQVVDGLIEVKKQEIEQCRKRVTEDKQTVLLLEQHCFDFYLRAILGSHKVRKFYIACGFVYASGIKMLRSEIDKLLADGMSVKILAGNLQHYFSDHSVAQMDLETAQELNRLIKAGTEVRTVTDCFYHGKMYILVCDDITFVISGSTNVSRNAFRYNNELDNLFVYSAFENQHTKHFEMLWNKAVSVPELDETQFMSKIASDEGEQRHILDIDSMRDRIQQIEDVDLKHRLVTWLKYTPSNIYDKIDVGGNEYIAIEFADKKMVVLESFFPGNSYFVFYNHSADTLLGTIEGRSKTEVFELSGMEKRGYHIREQLKLEVKIASYFV